MTILKIMINAIWAIIKGIALGLWENPVIIIILLITLLFAPAITKMKR